MGAHLEGQIHGATPNLVHVGQGPAIVLATAWAQLQVLRLLELEPRGPRQAQVLPDLLKAAVSSASSSSSTSHFLSSLLDTQHTLQIICWINELAL